MAASPAARYRRLVGRWVGAVAGRAVPVVVAALVLTVVAGHVTATRLGFNTDTTDMLSPELEFRRQSRALSEAFPQFSDNIMVVIDGDDPDLADDAALAMATRLRQEPRLFGDVYDPAGDPFFHANGLLYRDTDELDDLGADLARAQPFLGTLWRDPSLRGLAHVLVLAIDDTLAGGSAPVAVARVLDAVAEVAEKQAAGRFGRLSWQRLMMGDSEAAGGTRRLILLRPALDFGSLAPAAQAMSALRGIAAELNLDPAHGVRVRLTGSAALAQEEMKSVEQGIGLAGLLSLVGVIALLTLGLRSVPLVAATLVTLVCGLAWTAAFAALVIGRVNLISIAFAVLFIGLSVDFAIHFCLRYREEAEAGRGRAEALAAAGAKGGGALTLCAVAAAISFYAFLPTDYLGLAELGLIAGTGMFIAFFANLTMLPALLALMPARFGAADSPWPWAARLQGAIRRHARAVVWTAFALAVAAVAVLPMVRFDFDPLNLKDRTTESVSTLFDLMVDNATSPYTIAVLARSLDEAGALAPRLEALPEVAEVRTLADYVPRDQDEKLDIIAAMALYLAPAFAAERDPPPDASERRRAMDELAARLTPLAQARAGTATGRAAVRLGKALGAFAGGGALDELERRLLAGFPARLERLRRSLEARPVTIEDLPPGLRGREVAADGRARISIHPREDVHDHDALRRFVAAVRTVAPRATGSPVVILEAGNTIIGAFVQAGALSVAGISVLLLVLLRGVRDILLVFAPLILAALLTVAAMVSLDLAFNFANVIVLPLLFGLGVASGIHLVLRERAAPGAGAVEATSTPRAVVFSALTTVGSFGSLAVSSHPGTASMGLLLAIAISLTLACTLVVLPALMTVLPRPAAEREGP